MPIPWHSKKTHSEAPLQSQPPKFIFKSDVKSYYASINHDILIKQFRDLIDDPFFLDLICQYVRRTVVKDGIYRDVQQGIPLGCSLSPLMGAVYLKPLNEAMEKTGLFYARFMDDWVVLAPTQWKLRNVARIINQVLNQLEVWQHPDTTFVGRVANGFDFLGYHLKPNGLSVANKTRQNFGSRVSQLYEQQAIQTKIDGFQRRWCRWVTSSLGAWSKKLEPVDLTTLNHDALWKADLRNSMAHNSWTAQRNLIGSTETLTPPASKSSEECQHA